MLKTEGYENSELFMALTPKNGVKASKLYSYKPIDGTGDFHWSRNHTAYRLNQEGVLELMGSNVPRIDYTNTCPELLIEKASENIVLQSQTFDNASWVIASSGTGINPVVTANTTVAPDGNTTADTIVFNSGAGTTTSDISFIIQTISGVAGSTFSIWLKGAVGGEVVLLRINSLIGYVSFTLTTEWVRYTYYESGTPNSIEFGLRQGVPNTINSNVTIYAWGAQLEQSDYATSYIPTTTTTVTRPQDICYNTANTFGDTGWSIVMRVRLNNIGSNTFEPLVSLNDGSTDNYFCIYTDSNPKLYFDWYNNPDQLTLDTSDLTNAIYNIGISYDDATGDYIIVLDGSLEFAGNVGISLAGAFTGSLTRMDLGSIAGTGSPDADGIIGIQYYDSALTQTDLENLTTA